jgi:hypothetical protein
MKVCFVYDPETNQRFLEIISKMTPNRSGKWKDIEGTPNISEADWCVVIDSTVQPVPLDRTLFMSAHPQMENYLGYRNNTDKPHKLDNAETFGFGEWWLKYDYDYLSKLELPKKTEEVCGIISNSGDSWGREERKRFAKRIENQIHLYGRIQGAGLGELGTNTPDSYWFGKEDVLEKHKYSVEIDHGPCRNYFSERVFDSLLMWCKPLYWGSDNLEDFLPKESFQYIDIFADKLPELEPIDYKAIAEARDLLLNKYQIWARTYEYIRGING